MNTLRTYATLYQLRDRNHITDETDTSDDQRYLRKLREATQYIEQYTNRIFEPISASYSFDWEKSTLLFFRRFELLELTNGVTDTSPQTIPSASCTLLGDLPYWGIELDGRQYQFSYGSIRTNAITVPGLWGWHDDYASAWRLSSDTIPLAAITNVATSFVVTDSNGLDEWGLSPRFSVGMLIRVDSEMMYIVGTNHTTNTLTVVRHVNGSSAAAHTAGTAIYIYAPPVTVNSLCERIADLLVAQDDTSFGKITIGADGSKEIPMGWPKDIKERLELLSRPGSTSR